ncbi:Flagellin [compost metagenome]
MSNIVQRMKDLATQSANGTSTADDRKAMNAEFTELRAELDNITENTTFGGQKLLKTGSGFQGAVTFQIGGSSGEKLELGASGSLATALAEVEGTGKGSKGTAVAAGIDNQTKATAAMDELDTFSKNIGEARSAFGANINRLEHTVNNLSNMKENTDMANGRIMDADFAQESTNMTKNQMLMQAGMSVLSNSNQMTGMVTSLLR